MNLPLARNSPSSGIKIIFSADVRFILGLLLISAAMWAVAVRCIALDIEPGNVTEYLLARALPWLWYTFSAIILIFLSIREEEEERVRKARKSR